MNVVNLHFITVRGVRGKWVLEWTTDNHIENCFLTGHSDLVAIQREKDKRESARNSYFESEKNSKFALELQVREGSDRFLVFTPRRVIPIMSMISKVGWALTPQEKKWWNALVVALADARRLENPHQQDDYIADEWIPDTISGKVTDRKLPLVKFIHDMTEVVGRIHHWNRYGGETPHVIRTVTHTAPKWLQAWNITQVA